MAHAPNPGIMSRLRTQWAGISFEKKLSLFIAPVFVSVVTAVLIAALIGSDGPTPALPGPNEDQYRQRVRALCSRDGAAERDVKAKADRVYADIVSSQDFSRFARELTTIQLDTINTSKELAGELQSLTPPTSLEDLQADAVDVWRRQIDADQAYLDELRRTIPSGPAALLTMSSQYDASTARRLEDQKDEYLRMLASGGCNPTA